MLSILLPINHPIRQPPPTTSGAMRIRRTRPQRRRRQDRSRSRPFCSTHRHSNHVIPTISPLGPFDFLALKPQK